LDSNALSACLNPDRPTSRFLASVAANTVAYIRANDAKSFDQEMK